MSAPGASAKPILLALSTFRRSEALIGGTIDLARREGRRLVVAFVIDQNVDRYLCCTDVISADHLESLEKMRADFLAECRQVADGSVAAAATLAAEAGLHCQTIVLTGRFGIEITKLAKDIGPAKVVLTRSRRPRWLRRLFGSPVDYIIEHAGCQVLEAHGPGAEERGESRGPRRWLSALLSLGRTPPSVPGTKS